jgi:hypothetical protein
MQKYPLRYNHMQAQSVLQVKQMSNSQFDFFKGISRNEQKREKYSSTMTLKPQSNFMFDQK